MGHKEHLDVCTGGNINAFGCSVWFDEQKKSPWKFLCFQIAAFHRFFSLPSTILQNLTVVYLLALSFLFHFFLHTLINIWHVLLMCTFNAFFTNVNIISYSAAVLLSSECAGQTSIVHLLNKCLFFFYFLKKLKTNITKPYSLDVTL